MLTTLTAADEEEGLYMCWPLNNPDHMCHDVKSALPLCLGFSILNRLPVINDCNSNSSMSHTRARDSRELVIADTGLSCIHLLV